MDVTVPLQHLGVVAKAAVEVRGGVVELPHAPYPTRLARRGRQHLDETDVAHLAQRVDLEPGVAFGKHTHPGEEIIYVIEGSLEYQIAGKPPVALKAGDVLFIPAGTVHAAKNVGSVTGSELATYIVEKGKPLLTLVK